MAAGRSPHPPAWSRALRRAFRPFLSREAEARVARAVAEVEDETGVKIYVRLIGRAGGRDMLELARLEFRKRGLEDNESRADVLLLISHLDHRFAFWADAAIHARAGQALWEEAGEALLGHFKERRYPEGIVACVRALGRRIKLLS